MPADTAASNAVGDVSRWGRGITLTVAVLGWMFAGVDMAVTQLVGQAAAVDLLDRTGALDAKRFQNLTQRSQPKKNATSKADAAPLTDAERQEFDATKALVGRWFAWFQCAFPFGAATGGFIFGWLGDRIGRARGMTVSILTYSAMAAVAGFAQSPPQLVVAWFLASLGVGGMWPNGVALVSEAWSNMSRPFVAGMIGTSANVGIFLMNSVAATKAHPVTPEQWRWTMCVAATPIVLGLISLTCVPESPRWLAVRRQRRAEGDAAPPATSSLIEVFRPPLLWITLVGVALATVPAMGGWGSAVWMQPWAGEAGEAADPPDPSLKAQVGQWRAMTGMVGSLLGGWIAGLVGRRLTYFLVSFFALGIAQFIYWFLTPLDPRFLPCVAALGFFSGIYYGWLPLCLPELFPTRSRSTGTGISFNAGRILSGMTLFAFGALMAYFGGDYAKIGRITSWIFAVGLIVICFAPDTSRKPLDD